MIILPIKTRKVVSHDRVYSSGIIPPTPYPRLTECAQLYISHITSRTDQDTHSSQGNMASRIYIPRAMTSYLINETERAERRVVSVYYTYNIIIEILLHYTYR